MDHFEGDECATYDIEFEFRVVGFRNPVIASDVVVGDFVKHPASGEILEVYGAEEMDGGQMHLFFVDRTAAEVAQAWRDACEGHETTRGAIGDIEYCNGGCVGKGAW